MIIGIIGNSGCGKSTVSDYFVSKGFLILTLDKICNVLYESEFEIREKILQIFNTNDRKELGDIVFNDLDKLKELNDIYKPYIEIYIKYSLHICNLTKVSHIIIDGWDLPDCIEYDMVLKIESDFDVSLNRLEKREPNTNIETLKNRLKIQNEIKRNDIKCKNIHNILNNNTIEDLKNNINNIMTFA